MLLGILPEKDFFGRKEELADLFQRALEADNGNAQSICLSGPGGIGRTELLRQFFNLLFWRNEKVAPFFYTANNALLSVRDFSKDYLIQFICQRLAFEQNESTLLNPRGFTLDGLILMLEDRKAIWALEMVDRFMQGSNDPLASLHIAVNAPCQSALSTGVPVVVIIDEFQRLKNLRVEDREGSGLCSFFEMPMSFGKTPHFITGNQAAIQEMPFIKKISRVEIKPLGLEHSSAIFSSILETCGMSNDSPPYALLNHLGGNPFYIRQIAKAAGLKRKTGNDLWNVYADEINNGGIFLYLSAALKDFFPELSGRKDALEMLKKIYHGGDSFSQGRVLRSLHPERDQAAKALYLGGFLSAEFGILRPPKDRVIRDLVDCVYKREVLGRSHEELEKDLLERASLPDSRGISYDLTIPMTREAELIAAKSLEQICKNLNLSDELSDQLQMALIEACINAIEHSRGGDRMQISFNLVKDRLMISIESPGIEFVPPETGEPVIGSAIRDDRRGWGIKLMKKFLDAVKFEKTEKGTKVIFIKNLPKQAGIYKEDQAKGG